MRIFPSHRQFSADYRPIVWFCVLVAGFAFSVAPALADDEPFNAESLLTRFQNNPQNAFAPSNNRTVQPTLKRQSEDILLSTIQVQGNKSVSTEDILKAANLPATGSVSEAQIDRAVQRIKSMGVFQSVTTSWQGKRSGARTLTVTTVENPKIGKVRIEGAKTVTPDILLAAVKSKSGEIFNRNLLRSDIDAIRIELRKRGYLYSSVYDTSAVVKDGDDLVFSISEGNIEDITISGNVRTQPYVILREMNLRAGDPIVQDTLMADLRRIYNTNFFDDVHPEFLPGSSPRSQRLQLAVTERPAGTLSFGGGYGDRSNWFIYSDVKWSNVMGTGRTIGLRGQVGKTSSGEFSYFDPWAWGRRNSLSVKLWRTTGQFDAFGATSSQYSINNQARTGAEVGVGTPISDEITLSHTVRVEKVNLTDSNSAYGILSYRFGVSYDTRDVWFNPSKGVYDSIYYTKGVSWFGATEYQRFDIELRHFFPTFEKQTIAARLDFGRITDNPISTETYFVGGQSTVRGYNETDPAEVKTGRNQVVGSLEYRFLFSDSFQFVLFQDAGVASESFDDLFSSRKYIAGRGAGIRLTTPLGPLRFDLGFPSSGSMRIHFGIGNQF